LYLSVFNATFNDNNKLATSNDYLGQYQLELIEFIAEIMVTHTKFIKQYNGQNLSNTAWAVAKIVNVQQASIAENNSNATRIQQSALTIIIHVATEIIDRKASGFNAQELSNTTWAFATIGSKDTTMIQRATHIIVDKALQDVRQLNSQSASNLVWAVAKLFACKTDAIDHLFRSIGNRFSDSNFDPGPQHVSMTMWGFAKMNFIDDTLYRSIACRLQWSNASLFSTQNIANIVWALATAGVMVKDNTTQNIAWASQSISNIKNNHQSFVMDPVLQCCAIASHEFLKRPHEFNPQAISNLCWSFAVLGVDDSHFFTTVEKEIKYRINNIEKEQVDEMTLFNGQDIATILW
jgi:hypothetical protein